MLDSISSIRRFSLALVKLRSRLLTALNLLPTQHNELATDASDSLAVVFSEVGDGFEIRHQTPGQPHQLDVALSFSLQTSARLDAVEIALDVDL
jgi:hypothetical protein